MKINIESEVSNIKHKNIFMFEINTMQGDADDYHSFNIFVHEKKDVKKLIRYCKVLEKAYPRGKGGDDGFDDLDFFVEWFADEWYSYEGMIDDFEDWKLFYFNENGVKNKVSYILSDNDNKKINSYPILDW